MKKAGELKDSRNDVEAQTIIKNTILDCGDAVDERPIDSVVEVGVEDDWMKLSSSVVGCLQLQLQPDTSPEPKQYYSEPCLVS
jgi:hypothetical protein